MLRFWVFAVFFSSGLGGIVSSLGAVGRLDLSSVLYTALDRDPAVNAAQSRVEEARFKIKMEVSSLLPQVNGFIDRGRSLAFTPRSYTRQNLAETIENSYRTRVTASQSIFNAPNYASIQTANLEYEMEELRYEKIKNETLSKAIEIFYSVLITTSDLTLSHSAVQHASANYSEIKQRYEMNLVTYDDFLKSLDQLGQTKQNQIEKQQAWHLAKLAFEMLIGDTESIPKDEGEAADLVSISTDSKKDEILNVSVDEYVFYAVRNRVEVQLLEKEKKMLQSEYQKLRSRILPTLTVSGSYGYNDKDRFQLKDREWSLFIQGDLLLFDGFRNAFAKKQTKYRKAEASYRLLQQQEEIQKEVVRFYYTLYSKDTAVKSGLIRFQAAQEHWRTVSEKFRLKHASRLEMSNAELDLAQAKQILKTAHYEYRIAKAKFLLAVGTAFHPEFAF